MITELLWGRWEDKSALGFLPEDRSALGLLLREFFPIFLFYAIYAFFLRCDAIQTATSVRFVICAKTRSCDQNHPPLTAGEYSMGQCSFVWFDTESQPKPRDFEIRWVW